MDPLKLKRKFFEDRNRVFNDEELLKDPFKFSVKWSTSVEEHILKILKGIKLDCAIASWKFPARRELSPYSDIDVMFIFDKVDGSEQTIKIVLRSYGDAGIEVSPTVRSFLIYKIS